MDLDKELSKSQTLMFAVMVAIAIVFAIVMLNSCTYSITQVHTQGTASDVVDETATNSPSTEATIPVSLTGAK